MCLVLPKNRVITQSVTEKMTVIAQVGRIIPLLRLEIPNQLHKSFLMKEKQILSTYLPDESVNIVFDWIKEKNIHFKITRNRKTKLGDYRPPIYHTNHRISINHNLNPYAFLITFIHEYAHLLVFETNKNRVSPHGKEWKQTYKYLMEEFIRKNIFPEDIATVLKKSIQNSKSSSSSELELSRVLQTYDTAAPQIKVEDLPANAIFATSRGKKFIKGEKKRTRYKCKCIDNNKLYLFHALTPIIPISQ